MSRDEALKQKLAMRKIVSILSKNINQKIMKGDFNNDFTGLLDNSQPGRYILLTTMEEAQIMPNSRRGGARPNCNCQQCKDQIRNKPRISDEFFAKEEPKTLQETKKEMRKRLLLEARAQKKKSEKFAKKKPEDVAKEK